KPPLLLLLPLLLFPPLLLLLLLLLPPPRSLFPNPKSSGGLAGRNWLPWLWLPVLLSALPDVPDAGGPDAVPSFSAMTVVSATTAPAETATAAMRPRRALPRGRRDRPGGVAPGAVSPDGPEIVIWGPGSCSCPAARMV